VGEGSTGVTSGEIDPEAVEVIRSGWVHRRAVGSVHADISLAAVVVTVASDDLDLGGTDLEEAHTNLPYLTSQVASCSAHPARHRYRNSRRVCLR
jgi:hypothetical protein